MTTGGENLSVSYTGSPEGWRTSSLSAGYGECVEVFLGTYDDVKVSDTKDRNGPQLIIPKENWQIFLSDIAGKNVDPGDLDPATASEDSVETHYNQEAPLELHGSDSGVTVDRSATVDDYGIERYNHMLWYGRESLEFTAREWSAFIGGVLKDEFNVF